ncbi:hypothetical protein Pmani_039297 [Petrolisthes manimaculis]|uniref:Uncharacterized protein n=1 Tax=Petrolisthes manimaculis TaxID=1843537 RepID=A0AAE1TJP5_9EUCA|nr:hypothetical protein Pmani_039297 [Petrolisthes manimaculis]
MEEVVKREEQLERKGEQEEEGIEEENKEDEEEGKDEEDEEEGKDKEDKTESWKMICKRNRSRSLARVGRCLKPDECQPVPPTPRNYGATCAS